MAGHKGSGKSTELLLLKSRLEQEGYFVAYIPVFADIDLNDVDYPELFLCTVGQLAKQLRDNAKVDLRPGYLADRWKRLRRILGSEIDLDKVEIGEGLLKVSAALRSSPDTRIQFRKAMEPDLSNWLFAANDIISDAQKRILAKYPKGLVLIVDDLDKMTVRVHEESACSYPEYLFVKRAPQITGLVCHTLYSIPVSLAYSTAASEIVKYYRDLPVLPMVSLTGPPPTSKPNSQGSKLFREIVHNRLKHCKCDEKAAFQSPNVLDFLIKNTGGQPTELMSFVRDSIVKGLPVTREAVERVVENRRRQLVRMLMAEHWPIIEHARKAGDPGRTLDNDARVRELLDSRVLLQHQSGTTEWYSVNPALGNTHSVGYDEPSSQSSTP